MEKPGKNPNTLQFRKVAVKTSVRQLRDQSHFVVDCPLQAFEDFFLFDPFLQLTFRNSPSASNLDCW